MQIPIDRFGQVIDEKNNVNVISDILGNVTHAGGESTNVNVNSMLTTVSAGGGGW